MAGALAAAGERVAKALLPAGIEPLGWFCLQASDFADGADRSLANAPAFLLGSAGSIWQAFSASAEFCDGNPDPLDRWTQRVVGAAVLQAGIRAVALHPFGEPRWPFQQFARRATGMRASPLGLLIHPGFGLWLALRAAIAFPDEKCAISNAHALNHPCDACAEKPCLTACPVDAFSAGGFDAGACRSYLDSTPASRDDSSFPDCMNAGCAARLACPVGQEWRHGGPQLRFHMQAFKK